MSLLERFIYERVNKSKILHGTTIPVTLTKKCEDNINTLFKRISVHFI